MATTNGHAPSGVGGNFKQEKATSHSKIKGSRDSIATVAGLSSVVELVIRAGAYISFGATSDGGAMLIRILDGGDKLTTYCHSIVEYQEALHAIRTRYKQYAGDEGLPNTP